MKNSRILLFLLLSFTFYSCADSDKESLVGDFESNSAPTIMDTVPGDGMTNIPRNTGLSVTFSEQMNSATITTNESDTSCSGTLQLSADGFTTCIQMQMQPTTDVAGERYTVTPQSDLDYSKSYIFKITTGAFNLKGDSLASDYTAPVGFQTIAPITIFRINTPVTGGFGATHLADCESAKSAEGIPGTSVKPFISIGLTSEIKDIPGIPQTGVEVFSSSGTRLKQNWSLLWTENSIDVSLFAASVLPSSTDSWWSGTYNNGQTGGGGANDCSDWTADATITGEYGDANFADSTWIWVGTVTCDLPKYRLCVAW